MCQAAQEGGQTWFISPLVDPITKQEEALENQQKA
jgi:hypothetical protein